MLYFDPISIGFIPEQWRTDGTYDNLTWPEFAVLLTEEEVTAYWGVQPPSGKELGAKDGRPAWVLPPPPSPQQVLLQQSNILLGLKQEAESQKTALTSRISTLQDAIDNIGIEGMEEFVATPEEQLEFPKRKAQLTKWKNYAILLGRVTTQAGWPPEVVWPAKPTEGMDLTTNSAKTPESI